MANYIASLLMKISTDTGELERGLQKAKGDMGNFSSVGTQTGTMLKNAFTNVLLPVVSLGAALKVTTDVMNSSEGSADALERKISGLKGGVKGLYETILSGDFLHLIRNMEEGKKAAEELTAAQQDYEDMMAGGSLTKGRYERQLQSTRLKIAGTSDPEIKKQLIEEAMEFQRRLNEIDIQEKEKLVQNDVDFYQTKIGASKKYMDLLMKQIPIIAENEAAGLRTGIAPNWLGDQMTYYKNLIIEAERYKKAASDGRLKWTEEQEKSLKSNKQILSFYESFIEMREQASSPEQFTKFIEGLSNVNKAISDGDQNLTKLQKSLTAQDAKIEKSTKEVNIHKDALDKLNDTYKDLSKNNEPKSQYAQPTTPFSYGGVFNKLNHAEILSTLPEQTKEFEDNWNNSLASVIDNINDLRFSFEDLYSTIKGVTEDGKISFSEWLIILERVATTLSSLSKFSGNGNDENSNGGFFAGLSSVIGIFGTIASIFGFAGGTSYAPGGLSIVGERGPELVNLPQGSQVYTNIQSKSLLNNSGVVEFEIKGDRLYGVLNNYSRKTNSYV